MDAKQLPIPQSAIEGGGVEVLRAFIVNGGLQVSMQRAFDTPDVWGILLADIARHASRIFAGETGMTEGDALNRICELFEKEMNRPTDLGTTETVHRN